MHDIEAVDTLLTNALSAVADELSDLALEVAALGESLSLGESHNSTNTVALQKFDALTQALNAYAGVLQGLSAPEADRDDESLSLLLEKIPFFEIRERIRAKIFFAIPLAISDQPDELWVEC